MILAWVLKLIFEIVKKVEIWFLNITSCFLAIVKKISLTIKAMDTLFKSLLLHMYLKILFLCLNESYVGNPIL